MTSDAGGAHDGGRRRIAGRSPYEALIGYSRAVADADGWIYVSGSTGSDATTGILPDGVEAQCANALATIADALAAAGATFADVRRVRYILPDRADFAPCWPQLRASFGAAMPAATMIVAGLIDPRMKIEGGGGVGPRPRGPPPPPAAPATSPRAGRIFCGYGPAMSRHAAFAPVVDAGTRVLVLGSLPGAASLAAGRYYAHPQNGFWRLAGGALGVDLIALAYPDRLAALLAVGVGLWDVVASARRAGSLDAALRDVEAADLAALIATLPALRLVAFNGRTAATIGSRALPPAMPRTTLPSSSPAYTLALAAKAAAWAAIGDVPI